MQTVLKRPIWFKAQPIKLSLVYVAKLFLFFFAAFILGVYLAFSPMVNYRFFNEKVLFKPIKCNSIAPAVLGKTGKEVSFKNKFGDKLCGIYFSAPKPNGKTLLIHHGAGGNLDLHGNCEALAEGTGANCFIYDYAGFGKSEGSPSIRDVPDDARAAYNYLVNELHTDPKSIVQYGGSLGTGLAVKMAAEKPGAGLMLFSPYTSLKDVARETFSFMRYYPDFLLIDQDLETLATIGKVKVPVLIVHGVKDDLIRVHHGDRVFAEANAPKVYCRVPEGTHNGCGFYGCDAVNKFVSELK